MSFASAPRSAPSHRKGRGRQRAVPVTLPTAHTLLRFEERGFVLERVEEVDAKGVKTGTTYNRLTPQIDSALRQGKISQLAHDALARFAILADRVHLATACGGQSFEPREYEPGTPDFGARVERAADTIRELAHIKARLPAECLPFLEWVAPIGPALPWRKQARIWQPHLSRREQETWFFGKLEDAGQAVAPFFNMTNWGR